MIAPARTKVTTPFGWVKGYPLNKGGSYPGYGNAPAPDFGFHTGVDFSYSPDNKIYAPETGVVQVFHWDGKDYNGNYIIMQVGNRRHFLGHISKFLVETGQEVQQGQELAIMGDTGYADGAHLHWGLRVDGRIVNGLEYITEGDSGMEEVNIDTLDRMFLESFGRHVDKGGQKVFLGKSFVFVNDHIRASEEWRLRNTRAKAYPELKKSHDKLAAENLILKKQLEEAQNGAEFVETKVYVKKEK